MLNIKDELLNYKYINIESNEDILQENNSEAANLLKAFTKAYERIGKEQYKAVNGIDDIIDILEEDKEKDNTIRELKENLQTKDNEIKTLVSALVSISDMFDYSYSFIKEMGDETLLEQLKLIDTQRKEKLSFAGLSELGTEGLPFDSSYYLPIGTELNPHRGDEEILKVVKKGYVYKGKLIRKAEAIINKTQ